MVFELQKILHVAGGLRFQPTIFGLSFSIYFSCLPPITSISICTLLFQILLSRNLGRYYSSLFSGSFGGSLIRTPVLESSIVLSNRVAIVFPAVRTPLLAFSLIQLYLTIPSELIRTIPSELRSIQLSSMIRLASPSATKIPSDFEFSMQLYFILVKPVFSPPSAMFALIFASILFEVILAQEPSTTRIP